MLPAMHERKRPDGFYAYPAHRSLWRRLLWRLGFDPLSVRERLAQVRAEAADWERWGNERAAATWLAWGEGSHPRTEWDDRIQETIEDRRREVEALCHARP